jgi:hypothetical protein
MVDDRGQGVQELEVRLTRGVEELQKETTFKGELTQGERASFFASSQKAYHGDLNDLICLIFFKK